MDKSNCPDAGRRGVLRCGLCGFGLLLGGPAARAADESSLPALGDAAQGLLSPAAEARFGELIMAQIRAEHEYLNDVLLRDYLQGLVQSLRAAALATAEPDAPRTFDLFLLRDTTFNAFALPGGHIGVHTGLVVDARAQAQLAAVLAHEMSHITQRHIAQRLARAGSDQLLTLGSLVLAVLAGAHGNAQAAEGLMLGGQAAAADRALSFSRDNERDADRVGTSVLRASGYPPQAMASMLERLQNLSRLDNSDVFAFLRDHPMNSERIADAEARGGGATLPVDDGLRFWLMNARARVLSHTSVDALRQQARELAAPTPDRPSDLPAQRAAWAYGRALAWSGAGDADAAHAALDEADKLAADFDPASRLPLQLARGDLLLSARRAADALQLARAAQRVDPRSRAALHLQARALLALPDKNAARDFLREQTVAHPDDVELWNWLAQAQAATGAYAAQHRATAEAYALDGNVEGAVLQLKIAQRTPGADFIEASIIDARLQALQQRLKQQKALDKQLPL